MNRHLISGIYIHVPFCLKKCPYCNFYSEPLQKCKAKNYASYILKELALLKNFSWQNPTLYFGGGTPSLMSVSFFERVITRIESFTEATIEANPATFDLDFLKEIKLMGINRISLGIQTLQPQLLKVLQRPYSSKKALLALEWACKIFENVSTDIMIAIPGQQIKDLQEDLETLLSFPLKHISAYLLTFYPNTPFYEQFQKGYFRPLPEGQQKEMYFFVHETLCRAGFIHYEISSFAKPGHLCQHNIGYWKLKNYLGLGPGAVSFYDGIYHKNVENLNQYFAFLKDNKQPLIKKERLPQDELLGLKIAMGLRMLRGINLKNLGLIDKWNSLSQTIYWREMLAKGFLKYDPPWLRLGTKGLFIADFLTQEVINYLVYAQIDS